MIGEVCKKVVDGRKDVIFGVEGRLRRSKVEREEFIDFLLQVPPVHPFILCEAEVGLGDHSRGTGGGGTGGNKGRHTLQHNMIVG